MAGLGDEDDDAMLVMAYYQVAEALLVKCRTLRSLALTLNRAWGAAFISEMVSVRFVGNPPLGPHGLARLVLRKTSIDDAVLLLLARLFPDLAELELCNTEPRVFKLSPASFPVGTGPTFAALETVSVAGCDGVQHSTAVTVLAGGAPYLSECAPPTHLHILLEACQRSSVL
jgi:hypothetical protein